MIIPIRSSVGKTSFKFFCWKVSLPIIFERPMFLMEPVITLLEISLDTALSKN